MDAELEERLNAIKSHTLSDVSLKPAEAALEKIKEMGNFEADPALIPYFVTMYREAEAFFAQQLSKEYNNR